MSARIIEGIRTDPPPEPEEFIRFCVPGTRTAADLLCRLSARHKSIRATARWQASVMAA